MGNANSTMSSRITMVMLQLIITILLSCNIASDEFSRDEKVLFVAILICCAFVLCLPGSMWDGRWSIAAPVIMNGILLASLTFHIRGIPTWMYLNYVLVALMASSSSGLWASIGLGSLLSGLYAACLYFLGLFNTEYVFLLPTMAALTLVSTNKILLAHSEGRENRSLEEKVRSEVMCDQLTGLPNRAQYIERVCRAVECAKGNKSIIFAVFFIDLDGFKPINDQLGHKAGDAVLKAVAKRLQGCLRKGDIVGRYGGDEFTLLINNVLGRLDAVRVAERVLRKLQDPIDVGRPVRVGASIGIALSTNIHTYAEDLIRDADAAMYQAKAKGKNCYEISEQLRDVVA